MANHHYDVADSPDEHGIQQVWKRHRETLRFFGLIGKLHPPPEVEITASLRARGAVNGDDRFLYPEGLYRAKPAPQLLTCGRLRATFIGRVEYVSS